LKLSSDSKRNPQPIAWGNSNFECIALPIWGKNYASEDAQPVGWILYNAVGKELIQYRLIDNEWMPSISKTVFGSWFAARHLGRSQAPLIIIDQATLEIRRRDGSPEFSYRFLDVPERCQVPSRTHRAVARNHSLG
jgi:hypothetical protein